MANEPGKGERDKATGRFTKVPKNNGTTARKHGSNQAQYRADRLARDYPESKSLTNDRW